MSQSAHPNKLRERVRETAEAILRRQTSLGPIDLLVGLQWLHWSHVEQWQRGSEHYPTLERSFQSTPEKWELAFGYFREWAEEKGLQTIEVNFARKSVRDSRPLQVTTSGDDERERFFRQHYARPDLSPKKAERLKEKLSKAPDIVAFWIVGESRNCQECGAELAAGDLSLVEKEKPLCLTCADLDHLVFLPAGDMALSRRSKKLSPLSAIVVKFNKSRKRYERQGILVTEEALEAAEEQCAGDETERAARRAKAAVARSEADVELVQEMAAAIRSRFPGCPETEARRIAAHTAVRGSGRVGRSAAGRALDPRALEFAVIAHIRHTHTNYDTLLMQGVDRDEARDRIRNSVMECFERWQSG